MAAVSCWHSHRRWQSMGKKVGALKNRFGDLCSYRFGSDLVKRLALGDSVSTTSLNTRNYLENIENPLSSFPRRGR
jgi:hypothetical protein